MLRSRSSPSTRSATEPAMIAMPSSRAQPCDGRQSRGPSSACGGGADLVRASRTPPSARAAARCRRPSRRPRRTKRLGGCEVVVRRAAGAQLDARDARVHGCTLELPAMRRALLIAVHRPGRAARRSRPRRRGRAPRALPEPVRQHQLHRRHRAPGPTFVECLVRTAAWPAAAPEAARLRPRLGSVRAAASATRHVAIGACRGDVGPRCFHDCTTLAYGQARSTSGRSAAARRPDGVTCRYVRGTLAGFRIAREGYVVWRSVTAAARCASARSRSCASSAPASPSARRGTTARPLPVRELRRAARRRACSGSASRSATAAWARASRTTCTSRPSSRASARRRR